MEDEIRQLEQQLEEVRAELGSDPEALAEVEREVLGLISELRARSGAAAQTQKTKKSADHSTATDHSAKHNELQADTKADSKPDSKPDIKKPQGKAPASRRNAGYNKHADRGRPVVESSPSSPRATEPSSEDPSSTDGQNQGPKSDPYEANKSKWKSFAGKVTKRRRR